ncbi:MAG: TonB-dependent receptor [Brevundimonas sp.]|jgi:iron complex outermembrane recepter protein|uniref:TonB-dependent receptor n=1 Tax=Brevundimonas sp. TaxID=1871086 RepID=UPI00391D5354
MSNRKRAFWASTALMGGVLMASGAFAQSSGTVAVEETTAVSEVVITGTRGPRSVDGTIVAETIAKTRSTITQEYISTQAPGQTVIQSLNLVPGVTFTNSDPYGSSGGNLVIRGFDGNRISLTFDGIPLNDTGNYAIYTNQQLDPELIERAAVNQGTTDVDSPTASAVGGTVNYVTRRPSVEPGLTLVGSLGSFNYQRGFAMFDTGEFGPWGTRMFIAGSAQNYDKFKGPGNLYKRQFNAQIFQDLGGQNNYASLSFHWNRNRNNFYNNFYNMALFEAEGPFPENDQACRQPIPGAGAQNSNTQSSFVRWDGTTGTGSCTNYYNLRINPSDTGNIRGRFSYAVLPNLRFTFDPSFQYVMANGGGFTTIAETDGRLRGSSAAAGVDLNGDGDLLDNVSIYTPSNTNTRRYGVLTSLIWDIAPSQRVRVAYTRDYGRHRQTGEACFYDFAMNPCSVYGGKQGWGRPEQRVMTADGSFYRSRDRFSIAELNQLAFEYRGQFFSDALSVWLGVRRPVLDRELNQYCFSQNGTTNVRCTTETPNATLANGNVTFASTGTTQWVAPYSQDFRFQRTLPNVGATFRFADYHSVYASYAESLSAPRTDNLYQPTRNASGGLSFSSAQPETSQTFDFGYRFTSPTIIATLGFWHSEFQNRIVFAFDEVLDRVVDRNVGDVILRGVDAQLGWQVSPTISLYASASYNDSEVQDDLLLGTTPVQTFLPTGGKRLVSTPEWTFALRGSWAVTDNFTVGLQGKYTGDRFTTDVNDEIAPAYTVWDLDARYDLGQVFGIRDASLQLNVINLFDEIYPANISTGTNALPVEVAPGVIRSGSPRTASLGAPRTVMLSLRTRF